MPLLKTVTWLVVSGFAVVLVALRFEPAALRAVVSGLAVLPMLYIAWALASHARMIARRRAFKGLRQVTDDFLDSMRQLHQLKSISQTDTELVEAEEMIEEVVAQMHALVEEIRAVAGRTGPVEAVRPPKEQTAEGAEIAQQPHPEASTKA